LRREPKSLGDILTVSDDAGERAERSIRWPTDANLAGLRVTSRTGTGSKPPQQPATSATALEEARLRERLASLAPLKEAVVGVLQEYRLKLDIQAERQLLEETFEGNSSSLFLKLVSTVIEAKTLTAQARMAALRKLLRTPLFRTRFLDLNDTQLAWLLAAGNDRIVQVLWDPNGPGVSLRGLQGTTVAATQTTAAATVSTATAAQPAQFASLRPSDYREVFRNEEPYRDCLANQAKLVAAVQAAESRGELESGADMAWLVRKNFLQTTLLCPAGGQYSIEPGGAAAQEIECTVHGSTSVPSAEHRQFAALFATYEKARNMIAREGGSAKAIPLLESEHEKQPFNPYVSFLLGRAYIETQNYERAAQLLKPLSDEKDSNAAFAYYCGYAFYAVGNNTQAEVMFSRALSAKVEDSYEASREEVSGHAEFYLLRDRARWAARNALGRDLSGADDGQEPSGKRPMRFLDFKQMSEPEYPSQLCLRGLLDFEKALGPVLENFMQPEMRDRWASLYQKYAAAKGAAELKELLDYLRSLAKEYSGLLPEEPPVCPEKGFVHLQATSARVLLQCSVHKDLDPDAQVNLPPTTPAWQLHAINDLLLFMLRLKNPVFDRCLSNQERIENAFSAWDDPRKVPDLDDLVAAKKLGQTMVYCPANRTARYRLGHEGQVSCRLHAAFRQVERRLAAWPLLGGR
jgi:hypothetical protein